MTISHTPCSFLVASSRCGGGDLSSVIVLYLLNEVCLHGFENMKPKLKNKNTNSSRRWDKSAWLARSFHKDTSSAIFASPVCDIKIGACDSGLHSIIWKTEDESCEKLKPWTPEQRNSSWGEVTSRSGPACRHIEQTAEWLRHFFTDPGRRCAEPTLCYGQVKAVSCIPIWNKLKNTIGPGETITYGELAKLCGNPKASRHMGYAMGHNAFSLLVPCHRVVPAGGSGLGNYCRGRGRPLKAWLHRHERAAAADTSGCEGRR